MGILVYLVSCRPYAAGLAARAFCGDLPVRRQVPSIVCRDALIGTLVEEATSLEAGSLRPNY